MSKQIHVEVAYALPNKQAIVALDVNEGTSMLDAARQSGIEKKFPEVEIDINASDMGIFGKSEKDPARYILKDGDRVEIYRPLIADPKEVRKKRAAEAKAKKEKKTN